ncbi:MAG: NAD(P)/FAD-dependent oxidoreductase [Capsulimonas sp.]|uniref:phytoene desaturase family protein n=1 Tax=Capsulimonas sp. TaxID=2494211 RepID=UPI003265E2A1
MPSPTYDVIVIGAGHNGLVCACYLQRFGYRVLVVERRPIVGGAVCTEEIWPGYKIDIGSSVHIMIHQTPIVKDLELTRYGLSYIEMDPWAAFPLRDGRAICFHRDLDKTCASIAQVSPRDAAAYKDFITRWGPVARGVFKAFQEPPTMANFGRHVIMAKSPGRNTSDTLRMILSGYGRLLHETFESTEMRAALGWLAAQSGPPPTEIGSGPFAGWHAALHETGAWRARGGSGALTAAMRRAFEAQAGEVLTDAPVEQILVENGRACGVEAGGQRYRAKAVVSACHLMTTMRTLLAPEHIPDDLKRRLDALNVGNGFGMTVRCAASELPDYGAGQPHEVHQAMQLLCPTPEYLMDAYADYAGGRPSQKPPVLAMTFSALDSTLAPEGKHIVQLWSQYFPYDRRDGRSWDDVREGVADSICETLYDYAPNMRGAIEQRFIQTPLDLERTLGLLRGNVMHLEMSLDQMFAFRPLPELSEYQSHIPGLFLTGASTHPGGGVFGASGASAARVVRKALGRRR